MRVSLHFLSCIVGAVALLLAGQFLMAEEGPRSAGTRPRGAVPQIDKENGVFPKFKAHLVDRLSMGYKVGVADIDGDGKLDIIGLATEPSCLVWYKNPSWEGPRGAVPQRYVLTSKTKEYVDLAPYDIDGDGRIDLAIAHEFGMNRTGSGGLLHWLRCPKDPTQEWPMYVIGAEPTSHRIKWADIDGDGRKELLNAPIMGRNAKAPLWDVGVNLIWYEIPEPPARQPWQPHIIDNQLTVIHGISVVNWDNDGCDDVLVASFEGIHLYQPQPAVRLAGQKQTDRISWRKTKLGSGERINPNKRGSSEIDLGTIGSKGIRFLASVEPWHGNNVVVYMPDSGPDALWQRSIIDTTFNEGHALICADLDADGDDEIVAGYRGKGYGLYIYNCVDSMGKRWERIALDEGDMAASGVAVADINGDGRLDIICVGTATSNIKWYENLGSAIRHREEFAIGDRQLPIENRKSEIENRDGLSEIMPGSSGNPAMNCGANRLTPPSLWRGLLAVKAWEGTVTIPTYGWAEDVNPKFWALEGQIKFSTTVRGTIIYPYTMQDHLYRTKEDRTYKALFLENEYLKVTCLPQLGGRLHSVFDKTEGKEMFHRNSVIKPGMIAMRGAWISGGVEWNAGPQGHTVTILSPVDAVVGRNADGSAYLQVSNLEKSQRTRWTVRVTLYPGKGYLDEQIRIFNPTDAISPYYFWNCTAFPNRPGTRFIYPMSLGTDHEGVRFFSWPIDKGKDLSWLKNHETWASIFAVDCVFDFFGAYDADADRGIVQVADHHQLSGKKAWTWGTWDFGLVSQKNLTDDDGPYIEVQSGPLPTQSDYGMLLPRQEVSWQESWYPVHGLGDGFEYATKDVAIQTSHEDGKLRLHIIATSKLPGTICVLSQGHRELLKTRLDLSPADLRVVVLPVAPEAPVDVTIKTKDGELLASFVTPLPIPKISPPEVSRLMTKSEEQLTLHEKYLKGLKYDLATNRKKAREYYEKALADDGQYSPALRALAVLDIESGLYDRAIQQLEKALQRDSADGLSWYFLGVSYLRLARRRPGLAKEQEALRCAYKAVRCLGTASLGYDLAGRAYMRLADYPKAVQTFERAVQLNPRDNRAKNHLLLALYAAGNIKLAYKHAEEIVVQNPTELVPRALIALRNKAEMDRFVREVRAFVGEDDFQMLETALIFAELGLVKQAEKLLNAVCVEAVPQEKYSPIPLYYLAYFASLQSDQTGAKAYLNRAASTYMDYVFPSRPEEVEVFKYAIEQNPDDAYAHLYLGNLYGHLGRVDEAAAHWQQAAKLDPSLSVAFRNLGLYAWAVENELAKAEVFYRKAITARPKDQTLYRDLADVLLTANKRPEAIKVLESTQFQMSRRADIIIMLAQAYLDEKRYSDTINLLESTPYFVNWEGQTITWDIFHKAHMERGQQRFDEGKFEAALQDFQAAIVYPANIGVGRSNRPQEAPAQYWQGKALHALGRTSDARAVWKEGADGAEGSEEQNRYRKLCQQALSQLVESR